MAQRREVDPTSQKEQLILTVAAIGVVLVVVGGGWASMHLGYALDGQTAPASTWQQAATWHTCVSAEREPRPPGSA